MTLEDRVHALRLRLFRRAEEIDPEIIVDEHEFPQYCVPYQILQLANGEALLTISCLHPKHRKGRPGRPPELEAIVERRILAEALAQPAWGPQRISDQLGMRRIRVAPSTVYRALRRHGLGTRKQRFGLLERHSASRAGLLTARTRRALEKVRPTPSRRHVEANTPGELVCFDCFFIGRLKGVGKVWQITACDAASSYGLAMLFLGDPRAAVSAEFLDRVAEHFDEAGWRVKRVLTDGGSEFKAEFDQACKDREIRHTRTKPRHPFTNGFVERLQGTILHEHWRIEFRRRYFTKLSHLDRSLQSYLRLYNHDRPHRGYRTRGRTPAQIVWGALHEHD